MDSIKFFSSPENQRSSTDESNIFLNNVSQFLNDLGFLSITKGLVSVFTLRTALLLHRNRRLILN
jgi:hypothetical protein